LKNRRTWWKVERSSNPEKKINVPNGGKSRIWMGATPYDAGNKRTQLDGTPRKRKEHSPFTPTRRTPKKKGKTNMLSQGKTSYELHKELGGIGATVRGKGEVSPSKKRRGNRNEKEPALTMGGKKRNARISEKERASSFVPKKRM